MKRNQLNNLDNKVSIRLLRATPVGPNPFCGIFTRIKKS